MIFNSFGHWKRPLVNIIEKAAPTQVLSPQTGHTNFVLEFGSDPLYAA